LLCGAGEHQITAGFHAASQILRVAGLLHERGAIMGDLVNFKRFKKRAARDQSATQAEVNRTKFGRSKAERVLDQQRASRANDLLDQHRVESEDAS
jgi:Domain of unknown function (DUF4169)